VHCEYAAESARGADGEIPGPQDEGREGTHGR